MFVFPPEVGQRIGRHGRAGWQLVNRSRSSGTNLRKWSGTTVRELSNRGQNSDKAMPPELPFEAAFGEMSQGVASSRKWPLEFSDALLHLEHLSLGGFKARQRL